MFGTLSDRFSEALRKLSGNAKITDANVREAMADVRHALLEADVHFEVAEKFCKDVLDKAQGQAVIASLRPGQKMIEVVYDELVRLMAGKDDQPGVMFVSPGPTILMMCGLQGSGKTTTCGKLALWLKKQGKSVMLAAADLQRPAAILQLETLATQVRAEPEGHGKVYFHGEPDKAAEYGKAVGAAVTVCQNAVRAAKANKVDVLILDTAGRLAINESLMDELHRVNKAVNPHQIYLVIDAMTGQDAVRSAKAFNEKLELDGVILTKFDSDTRGGAALSVRQVTGKPIKFIGVGEKLGELEEFRAEGVAQRILGMGDIVGLVKKAQEQVSAEEAERLQKKIESGKLTMEDFLSQLKAIRKMGSMKSLLGMLPGIGSQLKDIDIDEGQIDRTEAIINSMTPKERRDVELLDNSRRRRIAKGSGTTKEDVSLLVKGFNTVAQMSRAMSSMSMMQRMKAMAGMGGMDLAALGGGGMPRMKAPAPETTRPKFKSRKRGSR